MSDAIYLRMSLVEWQFSDGRIDYQALSISLSLLSVAAVSWENMYFHNLSSGIPYYNLPPFATDLCRDMFFLPSQWLIWLLT